ncbi:MAG: 1-acyl-sn-glycerol-3-phosphate acyltransferase [Rhodospirillales bacterium]|nr:1-acyl-sn-glycerol-3-phosphate acyltransferase [Rhodospirillales bacterium]
MSQTTRPRKATRIPPLRRLGARDEGAWIGPQSGGRRLRAIRQIVTILLWSLPAMAVQAVLILLPEGLGLGRAKVAFARIYWSTMCRLIGLSVRVIGQPVQRTADGRPVVYVSNHSSWLDILVLGGRLDACFIAKEEVARWPLVGAIARLGRTVYVRRARTSTGRERDEMRARLAGGDNLILFPEGTTSDGSRVLPFRSAFLSIAELPATADGRPAIVQPVSVVYDRLGGLPTGRASRPLFAWYGDMDIGSHFWRLAQHRGLRATVLLHAPLDPAAFPSRKALALATWKAVADGASTLRQNRPAQPIDAAPVDAAAVQPAYA